MLWLLLFCLAIGLLTYGFNLFNLHLSIDNELAGFTDNLVNAWLAQGRWGTYLLNRFLLPHPIIPIVPMAITIAGLSASYVLSAATWRWPIDLAHYTAAPFAIGFPTFVQLAAFMNLSFAVAIGLFLASLAVYLVSRGRQRDHLLAVPLVATAISMYQPVILFPVVSFLAFAASRSRTVEVGETLHRLLKFALVLLASLALYYAVWRVWLVLGHVAPSRYIEQFVRPDLLVSSPLTVIERGARFTWEILSGGSDMFLEKRRVFAATIVCASLVVLLDAWLTRRSPAEFMLRILLIAGAVLCPLLVVVIAGGALPYRNLLGAPLGFAALMFMAVSTISLRRVRSLLVVLSVFCFVGFADGANRQFYAQSLVLQADRDLANRIVDRLHQLGALPESRRTPVEFVGVHRFSPSAAIPRIWGSTLGASFFEWDNGNPCRIDAFMRSMGYELARITPQQRAALQARITAMPVWPAAGSVQRLEGVFVVKFGDYSPNATLECDMRS